MLCGNQRNRKQRIVPCQNQGKPLKQIWESDNDNSDLTSDLAALMGAQQHSLVGVQQIGQHRFVRLGDTDRNSGAVCITFAKTIDV